MASLQFFSIMCLVVFPVVFEILQAFMIVQTALKQTEICFGFFATKLFQCTHRQIRFCNHIVAYMNNVLDLMKLISDFIIY